MGRGLVCGIGALALSIAYYAAATGVPASLLSDAVGADGLPRVLALALGLLGVLAVLRAVLARGVPAGDVPEGGGVAAHARALGMIALGAAYAVLTPTLGYVVGTIAFLFIVATYSGQRPSLRLAAISAAGGLVLWLVFVMLLGVAMPSGMLAPLLG